MHHLSCDLETYSSEPLDEVGAQKYVESDDFQILLFAYSLDGAPVQVVDMAQGETPPLWLISALRDPSYLKHAYNANFEWLCLSKYYGLLPVDQWRCTMFHGLYAGFPGSLAAAGAAMGLPEDQRKLATGKALITYFCKPCKPTKRNGGRARNLPRHDPEKWKLFKIYNAQDVVTEMEIERRLARIPVPDWLQKQWETNQIINYRGVALDQELVAGALEIIDEEREALTEEAKSLTGLENPNSIQQVLGWINRIQGGADVMTSLTKETVEERLQRGRLHPAARRMLEIRQELGKTSTKKYNTMAATVCKDGRLHGLLQFYKANRSGRWAGAMVQPQNLPRTYIEPLDSARALVKNCQREAIELLYGSVFDTAAQLIRTAFTVTPGHIMIDADFSAIEARVISWIAQETWRLDVFRTHGKIYEASASQMFGVPIDRIKKGNPEYSLRQKGKISELALGYGGGVSAMRRMDSGRQLDNVSDEEMKDIVNRWRRANPHIVKLWRDLEETAIKAVEQGGTYTTHGISIAREYNPDLDMTFMTMLLPSGRKSYYVEPGITTNRWGKKSILYYGIEQMSKKWVPIETYGGKLVENCLAEGTPVLTDRGWVPIEAVTISDRIWDGVEWCEHDGLIDQGTQEVLEVDGAIMTPNHKILTKEMGWIECEKSRGLNWAEVQLPDGYRQSGSQHQAKQAAMAMPMRMRQSCGAGETAGNGREETAEIMRLYDQKDSVREADKTWNVKTPGMGRVALNETALHRPEPSSVPQLRRARDNSMQPMAGEFREFLGGYGPNVAEGARPGQDRQRQGVFPGELPMDYTKDQLPKSEGECVRRHPGGAHDSRRTVRKNRNQTEHDWLQDSTRMASGIVVRRTGSQKPVYDIRNCGPRHRYVIEAKGKPRIVSNCIQSIARDCLGTVIDKLEAKNYPIVFHVHDEVVIDVEPQEDPNTMLQDVINTMREPIPWAPGLPLNADGWTGQYFKKD